MVNDLIELKKLTQSLIEQEKRIRLGIKLWESILESIPVPIFITNDIGGIEFVNKAMIKEMGLSKEDLEGKFCHQVVGGVDERFKCHCCNAKPDETFFKVDLVMGNSLYTHSKTPILNDDGNVIGYICTLNNVTALIKEYTDTPLAELFCRKHHQQMG
jgi:PAS domain S-box-containing protein